MKKFIMFSLIGASFFTSQVFAQGYPVIDVAAITQMLKEFQELEALYEQMSTSANYLSHLDEDSKKWMSLDFTNYFNNINKLKNDVERANDIISSDTNTALDQYNKLYPGYDGSAVRNYANDFKIRSNSLLKVLSAQIAVADDALANQKDINNSDKSSAAAVANLTLASLSNLNTQMSAEIRAANTYRASQTQNNIDQKQELQNFIGDPYKKHDPSKYKSCVGECS